MVCPYYKNKTVFDEFNEIILAFGGSPMNEKEFQSSELRNQRTGLDLKAMRIAYFLWDKSNGYGMSLTPSGARSELFDTLVKIYGDRKLAVAIKAQAYSLKYLELNGDWLSNFDDEQKEPDILSLTPKYQQVTESNSESSTVSNAIGSIKECAHSHIMSNETYNALMHGKAVSSSDIINYMLKNGVCDLYDKKLLHLFASKNVPVVFGDTEYGCVAVTVKSDNGCVVVLNSRKINGLSRAFVTESILHEMVHAITLNAITNPKTKQDRELKRLNKTVYKLAKSFAEKKGYNIHSTDSGSYAFANESEFIAYFMSDSVFRDSIIAAANSKSSETSRTFKGILKSIINGVWKFFTGNEMFSELNKLLLDEYRNTFYQYVYNDTKTQNLSKEELQQVYDNISSGLSFNETQQFAVKALERSLKSYETYPIDKNTGASYEKICSQLATRMLSLRSSFMSLDERQRSTEDSKALIELLNSDAVPKYTAMVQVVSKLGPYILDRIRFVENKKNELTPQELRFTLHSDFNTFYKVLDDLSKIVNGDGAISELVDKFNLSVTDDSQKITEKQVRGTLSEIINLRTLCTEATNLCSRIIRGKNMDWHLMYGHQVNSPTIDDYVATMFSATNTSRPGDMSYLEYQMGSIDRMENETLRIIGHIVTEADDNASAKALGRATELVEKAKKLKQKVRLKLYERDLDGNFTGYLVRKLNHGIHAADEKEFMTALNRAISAKYGISLEDDNKSAPLHEQARVEWQLARNEWHDIHSERQYTKEYYDAWAKLSQETRDSLRDINNLLHTLQNKPGIYDEKTKQYHYENFTNEEWKQFQSLHIQKKLLRSKYDAFGNKKTGPELKIAQELDELYETLYSGKQIKKNKLAWLEARNEVIERCGGQREYRKFLNGETNTFDNRSLLKWDSRNSRLEFKKNDDDEAIVFQHIYRELGGEKPYYGREYEEITETINEMLRPYKSMSGETLALNLSNAQIKKLKDLLKKQYKLKKQAIKNNPQLGEMSKRYGLVFNKYIEFKETEAFKDLRSLILDSVNNDIFLADMILADYGICDFSPQLGIVTNFTPYRWYQVIRAKDMSYMLLEPGDGWIERTDNSLYTNKDYDPEYGTAVIPKSKITKQADPNGVLARLGLDKLDKNKPIDRYDNSEVYNEITNSGKKEGTDVAEFYNLVEKTIAESNAMQTNRHIVDNYLLPLVLGSLYQRLRSKKNWFMGGNSKFATLGKYILELFGFRTPENNDEQYGSNVSIIDENGQEVKTKYDPFADTYKDCMPDGSAYRSMPQFYTRKLKDPAELHTNLVGIVAAYYKMSCEYAEKAKIADQCELMLEQLGLQEFSQDTQTKVVNGVKRLVGKRVVGGEERPSSNVYKAGREWLDMNLYNQRKVASGVMGWDATKAASTVKLWTTVVNLGLNPKVAIVGMLTTLWTHAINSLVGQKYDLKTAHRAGMHVVKNTIKRCITGDIANSLSKDKLQLIMELSGVANQLSRKTKGFNVNPVLEFLDRHSIFGMMSTCDYFVKAQITTTTFMSYRFVDGEFITKDDIRMRSYKAKDEGMTVEDWRKNQYNKWNDGISLFDALTVNSKNELIVSDKKYEKSWNKIRNVVRNRAEKFCEHADGMATEKQKSVITRGIMGSMVLIHRQYLPLMIQERYGHTVYDYDTQMYNGGLFRRVLNFLYCLTMRNKVAAAATGAVVASFLPFGALGEVIGAIGAIYMSHKSKSTGLFDQSVKELFNDTFYNFSDYKSTTETLANRYAFKQVGLECGIYYGVLQLAVNMLCFYADDPSRKKWKLLLAIAYWARGLLWEAGTPYRTKEIFDAIKSPSAALSLVDRIEAFTTISGESIFNNGFFMLASLFGKIGETSVEATKKVRSGTYKGRQKWIKNTVQATPFKNIIEQVDDSKHKREYQERQLMGLSNEKKDQSISKQIYNWMFE